MRYEFRCQSCGETASDTHFAPIGAPIDHPCTICGGLLRRMVSTPGIVREMAPHFNIATGTYVTNNQHHKDELSRAAEKQSIRTGMDVKYQQVDLRDNDCNKVNEEGKDAKARKEYARARGQIPPGAD